VRLATPGVTATAGLLGVTATTFDPAALVYTDELPVSGVYIAVRVSLPGGSEPAGMSIVTLPPMSIATSERYTPDVSVTDPVTLPDNPFTVTVTFNGCSGLMLWAATFTVTAGTNRPEKFTEEQAVKIPIMKLPHTKIIPHLAMKRPPIQCVFWNFA
jgi:hypothetical protein